ncbi:MAG: class I SAM-dependent methyltransferase [Candidatus Acidiferrum sp.]
MNLIHRRLCRSATWHNVLREYVVPWVLKDVSLGSNLLELGPGHGLTTELLRPHVTHLTALEIDARLADSLAVRFTNSNVTVVRGDAAVMPLKDAQFSAAVCLHMLHHVHSPDLQDKVFREVWRVLKPGAVFVGVDSLGLQKFWMRAIHLGDTLVPVDPTTLAPRLRTAGFQKVSVDANPHAFRFHAQRPAEGS